MPIFVYNESSVDAYITALASIIMYPLGTVIGVGLASNIFGKRQAQHFRGELVPQTRFLRSKKPIFHDFGTALFAILPTAIILLGSDFTDLLTRDTFPLKSISKFNMGLADTIFWFSAISVAFIFRRTLRFSSLFILTSGFAAAASAKL